MFRKRLGALAFASLLLLDRAAAAAPSIPSAGSSLTAPPPASAFAERPFFTDPVVSPSGKWIAARIHGDNEAICVIAVAALEKGCAQRLPLGKVEAADLLWVGDDKLSFSIIGHTQLYYLLFARKRFFVLDAAAGKLTPLNSKRSEISEEIIWIAPTGGSVLLSTQVGTASTPGVKLINVDTGESTEVQKAKEDVYRWFADRSGFVRAGFGYVNEKRVIWYRDTADEAFRRIELHRLTDQDRDRDDDMIDSLRFDGPGGKPIVETNARTGRFGVYSYDPGKDQVGGALFEHPEVDAADLVVDPTQPATVGVAYEDDRPHVKWFDPALEVLQRKIDNVFPDTSNRILNRSRDGNLVLLETSSPDRPGMYYLFNQTQHRMDGLTSAIAGLDGAKLAANTQIHYKARDGLDIVAYLTLPPNRTASELPLVVMPHGGPFERDHWVYDPFVQYLASRGYAVLQPQYRGSTGYGRSFVEKGYGQWGRGMQDDLLDGIKALAYRGVADPKRVCIFGASYGGYAAMWAAARDVEHYRCAASYAGVSDLVDLMQHDRRTFHADRYVSPYWEKRVEGNRDFDLAGVSPLQQQRQISIPLLIAHGEQDTRVPSSQSHRLVDALTARHSPVESVFYKSEGHGFSDPKDLADFLSRLGNFLERYNPS